MIVTTNKLKEGTCVEEKNGDISLTHVENIDPVLEANYHARKDSQNGWAKDRSYRRIASVPFLTWLEWSRQHPELIAGDKELREKTLNKLLYSEDGKKFWTVEKGI